MDLHSKGNEAFVLTNRMGGYVLLSSRPESSYEGAFFMHQGDMFKVIDRLEAEESIQDTTYHFWSAVRDREGYSETFFMPIGMNALLYQTSRRATTELVLDARKSHDMREWGRLYSVDVTDEHIIITYTKVTDAREDSSHGEEEYRVYLVIDREGVEYEKMDAWRPYYYAYDSYRSGQEVYRYNHIPLRLTANTLYMGFGCELEHAKQQVRLLKEHCDQLKEEVEQYTATLIQEHNIEDTDVSLAYACSINALEKLTVHTSDTVGMLAGLPWFYQFWSRDELISLGGLMYHHRLEESATILKRYAKHILEDGRIPNRYPPTSLSSADGIGWFVKRLDDFLTLTEKRGIQESYFSKSERRQLVNQLELGINRLMQQYMQDGLIYNQGQETWMDTAPGIDGREGYRIEIQAQMMYMLSFLYRMSGNYKYWRMLEDMRGRVRKEFFADGMIADGQGDWTQRPNIFIAAYIYPQLFTTPEWTQAFRTALDHLWLEWGGLASIEKEHALFTPYYSGEDDRSYHRGDSWYFINNMAAVALHAINAHEFDGYVQKILQASTSDILHGGVAGGHAELSSAGEQRSEGSMVQLWSSALFIELYHEIFKRESFIDFSV